MLKHLLKSFLILICFNSSICHYKTETVEFSNEKANIKLRGTLNFFKNSTKCVVLAHPYFPQNHSRSNEIMKLLADNLSNYNITVLVFDERGTGESEGNFTEAKADDFADDVLAGLDYIKTRKELKNCKNGIIGYSKGASS